MESLKYDATDSILDNFQKTQEKYLLNIPSAALESSLNAIQNLKDIYLSTMNYYSNEIWNSPLSIDWNGNTIIHI